MHIVSSDGLQISYTIDGNINSHDTIAFCNGIISSINSWDPFVHLLEHCDFKILRHDFRGQYLSDKSNDEITFKKHAEDFIAILDKELIDTVNLIGTSYGSIFCLYMAINYSERVSSLMLINPVAEVNGHFTWTVTEWLKLCKKRNIEELYNNIASIIYSSSFFEKHYNQILQRREQMKRVQDDFWSGLEKLFINTLENTFFMKELHKISQPTLVIAGDEDRLTPVTFARNIYQRINGAELIIIEECGHASIIEKSNLLTSMIIGFILNNQEIVNVEQY